MDMISIKNLTRDYGNQKGIFDVSFSIPKGEVFGFLGPNGAGKTTTIRHLMGFVKAKQGSCEIDGKDCFRDAATIQENLGYIPGEIAFMDSMTGNGLVEFMAKYRGISDLSYAKELMKRFELDPTGKLKKMSKGMKQKIGIVCAFMHDPAVLVLDEPTSGLDPLMQNRFIELILEEKERGKTILMSSHMFEEVERTCDRVGIIRNGKLVAVDKIAVLKSNKQNLYRIKFKHADSLPAFLKEEITVVTTGVDEVTVSVKGDINQFLQLLTRYSIASFDSVNQSLEEIFMQFYGGDSHD